MIYNLSVELEAANLGEALDRIKELPTDFSPREDFADWLRAYNLYGGAASISYVNRLDVSFPEETEPTPLPLDNPILGDA